MSLIPNNNNTNAVAAASRPSRRSRAQWTDFHIRTLINERRRRNFEYWYLHPGRDRDAFWRSVANHVNMVCNTGYTGDQCASKFSSLVTAHNVSK